MPICWQKDNKPHKFDPGCGHGSILKALGYAIDELKIQDQTVFGIDIGCSLLAAEFFDIDTIQTHHGRTTPVMVGFKRANQEAICLAYMGDGGAYAIGAGHLVAAASRNEQITCIVVNNANYGMTGGQMAPTSLCGQITDTTPSGRDCKTVGQPFLGPEMVRSICPDAFVARISCDNLIVMISTLKKAINHQLNHKGFSFVEILSYCPVNWKTDAKGSIDFMQKLKEYYPLGELKTKEDTNS